ncbi:protein U4.5 [Proboscivirus elephantidbeta4]|uniref:Protein U4.5 n=1 Tax=Elephant endotheliotropic herpesvirus 4 TaxID=548914 RepID=A0A0S1TQC4_9BETA|nr:protein U4.5 [Elephant endotheliotropic herpesvirus 4]ALM25974.1 protein U4.5 [Elephant endotheliotropic herpesvirus 4]
MEIDEEYPPSSSSSGASTPPPPVPPRSELAPGFPIPGAIATVFPSKFLIKSIPLPSDYSETVYSDDFCFDEVTYLVTRHITFTECRAPVLDLDGTVVIRNLKRRRAGGASSAASGPPRAPSTMIDRAVVKLPRGMLSIQQISTVRLLTCDGILFIKGLDFASDAMLWHILCSFLNRRPNTNYLCYCNFTTFSNILLTMNYRGKVNRYLLMVNKLLAMGYYIVGNFNYVTPDSSMLGYLGDVITAQVVAWSRLSRMAATSDSPKIAEAFRCIRNVLTVRWLRIDRTELSSDPIYRTLLAHEQLIAGIFCDCPVCRPPPRELNAHRSLTVKNWGYRNVHGLARDPNVDFRTRWNLAKKDCPEMPRLMHAINVPTICRGLQKDRYLTQFYKFQNVTRFHVLTHTCGLAVDDLLFVQWYNEFLFLYFLRLYLSRCIKLDYTRAVSMYTYYLKSFRHLVYEVSCGSCVHPSVTDLCDDLGAMLETLHADTSMTTLLKEICKFNRIVREPRHAWLFPRGMRDDTSVQGKVLVEYLLREKFPNIREDDPVLEHVGSLRSRVLNDTLQITFNEFSLRQLERSMWLQDVVASPP